jgi:hypothetical protein
MNRVIVILLVSVLWVGLAACAAHGNLWFGADSTTQISHGLGCGVPLMTLTVALALSLVLLTGRWWAQPRPQYLLRLPVSFFQPPERSA